MQALARGLPLVLASPTALLALERVWTRDKGCAANVDADLAVTIAMRVHHARHAGLIDAPPIGFDASKAAPDSCRALGDAL